MDVTKVSFPETAAFYSKPDTRKGTKSVVRADCTIAIDPSLPYVTLLHKGNNVTSKAIGSHIRGHEQAKHEFSDFLTDGTLEIRDYIAEEILPVTLLITEEHSVKAKHINNRDYVTDKQAALIGSVSVNPRANTKSQTGHDIGKATHGTAPPIAARCVANPRSTILSIETRNEHWDWTKAAARIEKAYEQSFHDAPAIHA